jgi:mannose-6-phosphate isomerase-like protein (cupin superfamily)
METEDHSGTAHVGPGEGRVVRMPGEQLLTRKVSSQQTGGAYSLFEAAVWPRGGADPHIQHEEDECFYVLGGVFEFLVEDIKIDAGPGSLVYVPKGTLHAFKNVGAVTGQLLVSQTPGGLHERFDEETGESVSGPVTTESIPSAGRSPNLEKLAAIGAEYGVEMVPRPHEETRLMSNAGAQESGGRRTGEEEGER